MWTHCVSASAGRAVAWGSWTAEHLHSPWDDPEKQALTFLNVKDASEAGSKAHPPASDNLWRWPPVPGLLTSGPDGLGEEKIHRETLLPNYVYVKASFDLSSSCFLLLYSKS